MLKKLFPVFICLFFLLLFAAVSRAAGPPMGPPMGPPPCWPPNSPACAIPLDGGISLLIAAGIALGGKKIYDFRKKAS